MMTIDDGKLRAYLDGELAPPEVEAVEMWLSNSVEARSRLDRLQERERTVANYLSVLSAGETSRSRASLALQRFEDTVAGETVASQLDGIFERMRTMLTNSFLGRHRAAVAVGASVVVLAALFSLAPVRALAGDFLKIFRMESVKTVLVDADHLSEMEKDPQFEGMIERLEVQAKVLSQSEPEEAESLAEAGSKVGFQVKEIAELPQGLQEPDSITFFQKRVVSLNLDRELLEAMFEAADIQVNLPASLDNNPIVVTEPASVVQDWGDDGDLVLKFVQMVTPQIEYPQDVDLQALGAAGLQLLGVSEEDATEFAQSVDWNTTLVMPIPDNGQVTVKETKLNGRPAYVFTSVNKRSDTEQSAVMWQQDGFSYFLKGTYTPDELLAMAASVR